jgi:carbon storage regulator
MGQKIVIDDGRIIVTVIEFRGDKIRLGIDAPPDCAVDREEIHKLKRADRAAGGDGHERD